jgi:hypothetical protein
LDNDYNASVRGAVPARHPYGFIQEKPAVVDQEGTVYMSPEVVLSRYSSPIEIRARPVTFPEFWSVVYKHHPRPGPTLP